MDEEQVIYRLMSAKRASRRRFVSSASASKKFGASSLTEARVKPFGAFSAMKPVLKAPATNFGCGAFGAGYDSTDLFPGIRKVAQAAGRVIRTLPDTGVHHLIDDRFARPEVRRLLPTWWCIDAFPSKVMAARDLADTK